MAVCVISGNLSAGRKAGLRWRAPEGSFLNYVERMDCAEIQEFIKLAQRYEIDFKLIYKPGEKAPRWFGSPIMFELLKALDYSVTFWFSDNDEKIDSDGHWKRRISKGAVDEMEACFGSTYDNNLIEMLSAMICHVFSEEKMDVKSRDYIILRLLWVNEQILPDGMGFNWTEKYRSFKYKEINWSISEKKQLEKMVAEKDRAVIGDILKDNNTTFMKGYTGTVVVNLDELYKSTAPDIKYDMLMIWDALIHKYRVKNPDRRTYIKGSFSKEDEDPLFDFYFSGLMKLELLDSAHDIWKKALTVAWRQRFIIERQQRKNDIPEEEWNWLPSAIDFDFPDVPNIKEIPSRDLLSKAGKVKVKKEVVVEIEEDIDIEEKNASPPESPIAATHSKDITPKTFEETLQELKVRLGYTSGSDSKCVSALDYQPILESEEIKQWNEAAVNAGLNLADIVWPDEECPAWYDSPILYQVLSQFSYCAECWIVEHQHEIDVLGKWIKYQDCDLSGLCGGEGEGMDDFETSLDKTATAVCDNNLLDMLAVLLSCALSDDYSEGAASVIEPKIRSVSRSDLSDNNRRNVFRRSTERRSFNAMSRIYTKLRFMWICKSMFPRNVSFDWRQRFQSIKADSDGWNKVDGLDQIALKTKKDNLNRSLKEKYPDDLHQFERHLLWEKECIEPENYDERLNVRLVWDLLYKLCCSKYAERRKYGQDPFLNVYTKGLLKIALCDPAAFADDYMRVFIVALYQRFLIYNREVRRQQFLVDGWKWYSGVMEFKFPDVGEHQTSIPFDVDGLNAWLPVLQARSEVLQAASPASSLPEPEVKESGASLVHSTNPLSVMSFITAPMRHIDDGAISLPFVGKSDASLTPQPGIFVLASKSVDDVHESSGSGLRKRQDIALSLTGQKRRRGGLSDGVKMPRMSVLSDDGEVGTREHVVSVTDGESDRPPPVDGQEGNTDEFAFNIPGVGINIPSCSLSVSSSHTADVKGSVTVEPVVTSSDSEMKIVSTFSPPVEMMQVQQQVQPQPSYGMLITSPWAGGMSAGFGFKDAPPPAYIPQQVMKPAPVLRLRDGYSSFSLLRPAPGMSTRPQMLDRRVDISLTLKGDMLFDGGEKMMGSPSPSLSLSLSPSPSPPPPPPPPQSRLMSYPHHPQCDLSCGYTCNPQQRPNEICDNPGCYCLGRNNPPPYSPPAFTNHFPNCQIFNGGYCTCHQMLSGSPPPYLGVPSPVIYGARPSMTQQIMGPGMVRGSLPPPLVRRPANQGYRPAPGGGYTPLPHGGIW